MYTQIAKGSDDMNAELKQGSTLMPIYILELGLFWGRDTIHEIGSAKGRGGFQ
jgi:hypothetical protein